MADEDSKISVSSSGLGQLTKMLGDHLSYMREKDKWVELFISNFKSPKLIQDAKDKALKTEEQLLRTIMDDIIEMTQFLNDIVLIENKFNALYAPHKSKQENARNAFAPNIAKYENLPKAENEIPSFVELMFGSQVVHVGSFQTWIDAVTQAVNDKNIKLISNTGAHCKKIERAFYKAFYVYTDKDGFKQLTDVLRCSFVFDNFDDLYQTFAIIEQLAQKEVGGILRVKDRFNPKHVAFGYRDLLINMYCPRCKIVCEIQLHHSIFYKMKKISHQSYKRSRLFQRKDANLAYDYAIKYIKPKIGNKQYVMQHDDQTTEGGGTSEGDEGQQVDYTVLLKRWKMEKFIANFEEDGWDDIELWDELVKDEAQFTDMGMKKGHRLKFIRNYEKWKQESGTGTKSSTDQEQQKQKEELLLQQKQLLKESREMQAQWEAKWEEKENAEKSSADNYFSYGTPNYAMLMPSFVPKAKTFIKFQNYVPGKKVETNGIARPFPTDFTCMGYVNICRYPTGGDIGLLCSKEECCVGRNQFRLQLDSDGRVSLFAAGGPLTAGPGHSFKCNRSRWGSDLATEVLELNRWYHMALVVTKQKSEIFVNGKRSGSARNTTGIQHNSDASFRIGTRHQGGHRGFARNFDGKDNDLHDPFYGYLNHWMFTDCCVDEKIVISYGNVASKMVPEIDVENGRNGIKFRNYKPGLKIETNKIAKPFPTTFTVMGYIWIDSYPSGNRIGVLCSKEQCCVGRNQFRLQLDDEGVVMLFVQGGPLTAGPGHRFKCNTSRWGSDLATAKLKLKQWHHIALLADKEKCQIFVNGKLNCVAKNKTANGIQHNSDATFRLGTRHQGGHRGFEHNYQRKDNDLHDPLDGRLNNWLFTNYCVDERVIKVHGSQDTIESITSSLEQNLEII